MVFSVRYVRYYNSDSITCDLTHVTDGQINLPAGVLFSRISLRADQHAVALLHPLGSVITHTGGLEDVTGRNTNLGLGRSQSRPDLPKLILLMSKQSAFQAESQIVSMYNLLSWINRP